MFLDPFKFLASSASRTWLRCQLPGAEPPGPAACRGEAAPVWPRVATACVNLRRHKTNTAPALGTHPPTGKQRSLNKRQLICELQREISNSSLRLSSAYANP